MLGLGSSLVGGIAIGQQSKFSVKFDGTNDHIKTGGNSSTKPTAALTVSLWVNIDTAVGGTGWPNPDGNDDHTDIPIGCIYSGGWGIQIIYGGTGSNPTTVIAFNAKVDDDGSGSAGYWSGQYYNPSSGAREADATNLATWSTDGYLPAAKGLNWGGLTQAGSYTQHDIRLLTGFQHIVGTWDGQYAKLYVNGVLKRTADMGGSGNVITNPSNAASEVMIGADLGAQPSGSADYTPGLIDDVAIWNAAIDADGITKIYNSGPVGLDLTSADGEYDNQGDLQAWWKMEEGTGTSVADSSTNSNTATLVNGPTWSTITAG